MTDPTTTISNSSNSYLSIGSSSPENHEYEPVEPHWFYCQANTKRNNLTKQASADTSASTWQPFSVIDSNRIEQCYKRLQETLKDSKKNAKDASLPSHSKQDSSKDKKATLNKKHSKQNKEYCVPTEGGLFDVDLLTMQRIPVYWRDEVFKIQRCTWFHKREGHTKFEPYDTATSEKLEKYYKSCCLTKDWIQRHNLSPSELLVINGPNLFLHYEECQKEEWVNMAENPYSARQVNRGVSGIISLEPGDLTSDVDRNHVDHLIFFVHGVGGVCDVRFRSCTEVVSDFRRTANTLLNEHCKDAGNPGALARIKRSISRSSDSSSVDSSSSNIGKDSDTQNDGKSSPTIPPVHRRVEFLPISWHSRTRRETNLNEFLNSIALNSVPKLRQFVNKLIIDALLYSSGPIYSQTIIDIVGDEINRLYSLFMERHPSFTGSISLAGHSLGSVILFDLLANQNTLSTQNCPSSSNIESTLNEDKNLRDSLEKEKQKFNQETQACLDIQHENLDELLKDLQLEEYSSLFKDEKVDLNSLFLLSDRDLKEINLPLGPRRVLGTYINFKKNSRPIPSTLMNSNHWKYSSKNYTNLTDTNSNSLGYSSSLTAKANNNLSTGQWSIRYPQLKFKPRCFFAFGSPIAMFLAVRGIHDINPEYQLPTCNKMFNIFHPYDPLAYRIEPLIDSRYQYVDPVLIPHHKGGKRMHLQLRDGIARIGSDLKYKIWGSLKKTWSHFTRFSTTSPIDTEVKEECPRRTQSISADHESRPKSAQKTSYFRLPRSKSFSSKPRVCETQQYKQTTSELFDEVSDSDIGKLKKKRKQFATKSNPDINISSLESIIESVDGVCSESDEFESQNPDSPGIDSRSSSSKMKSHSSFEDLADLAKSPIGLLNDGSRVDHVLQEKPIEYVFNEYVFAFSSHASYWQNEDSAIMMLNEIYKVDKVHLFDYFD